MIDEDQLIKNLESTIIEITERLSANPAMQTMVRLLESTRARVLMDVVAAIKASDISAPKDDSADI
jgi:hypothetical protein